MNNDTNTALTKFLIKKIEIDEALEKAYDYLAGSKNKDDFEFYDEITWEIIQAIEHYIDIIQSKINP